MVGMDEWKQSFLNCVAQLYYQDPGSDLYSKNQLLSF
jgi:hypothetical protein